MAAAPADFRPAHYSGSKIKKSHDPDVPTGDESGTVMDHARAKLERKGCDLLVVNEVGPGKVFGQDDTTVHILQRDGSAPVVAGPAPKEAVAATLWDVIQSRL